MYVPTKITKYGPYTQVVFICMFSSMESIYLGTCKKYGLYKQVVFMYRCSLEQVRLYDATPTLLAYD